METVDTCRLSIVIVCRGYAVGFVLYFVMVNGLWIVEDWCGGHFICLSLMNLDSS
jgi:hypothetical protein